MSVKACLCAIAFLSELFRAFSPFVGQNFPNRRSSDCKFHWSFEVRLIEAWEYHICAIGFELSIQILTFFSVIVCLSVGSASLSRSIILSGIEHSHSVLSFIENVFSHDLLIFQKYKSFFRKISVYLVIVDQEGVDCLAAEVNG
jgi:hypothetical protein